MAPKKKLPRNKFAGKPLTNVQSSRYPNFIREISQQNQGKIFRWSKNRISFYIDGKATNRLTKAKIKRAFRHWEDAIEGLFVFDESFDRNRADVVVKLTSTSEKNRLGEAGPSQFKRGDRFDSLEEYIISKAEIIISEEHFSQTSLSREYQKNRDPSFQTLIHEIGHVLGLTGHSPRVGDCLYYRADPQARSCYKLNIERNTLAVLYGKSFLLRPETYR